MDCSNQMADVNVAIAEALGLSIKNLTSVEISLAPQSFPTIHAHYRMVEDEALVETLQKYMLVQRAE